MTQFEIPSQQHAILVHHSGGPEELSYEKTQVPTPGPNEILVRTEVTGVNFIETYQRSGTYPVQHPFIPGTEAAGKIVELGSDVDLFKVGERIVTAFASATYSQYFTVPAHYAVAIPQAIDSETATAAFLQGTTAHYLIRSTFEVKPEHTVLFHAGAGGVGGLAVQLLKSIGATVITTVSTDEKEQIARSHGADHVLRYENFADDVRKLTGGNGVDVVYDSVGKTTFYDSLTCLKTRGLAVLFGASSGPVPPLDLQQLNRLGSLYVTRPSLVAYLSQREEFQWRTTEIFEALINKSLKVRIDRSFPLKQAQQAHEYLEARQTRGKVLLLP